MSIKAIDIDWKYSDELVQYEDALSFMDARVSDIYKGAKKDCIWMLEHPALYTAGTSAQDSDLISPQFPVFQTGRGGEYTYHGPGQCIAYVMLNLKKHQEKPDIKRYVWFLEEWIIQTLAEFGVKGERRCGRVGIWVDMSAYGGRNGEERKIAAIGVRIRRWVTLHGVSINLDPDLSHFGGIVPCGIAEHGVTSMEELGAHLDQDRFRASLARKFVQVFEEVFGAKSLDVEACT